MTTGERSLSVGNITMQGKGEKIAVSKSKKNAGKKEEEYMEERMHCKEMKSLNRGKSRSRRTRVIQ